MQREYEMGSSVVELYQEDVLRCCDVEKANANALPNQRSPKCWSSGDPAIGLLGAHR